MSFTYVLHARPLRICIRTPSSAPIDRSPGGFWDSANLSVQATNEVYSQKIRNIARLGMDQLGAACLAGTAWPHKAW